jgi:hypothetical protein
MNCRKILAGTFRSECTYRKLVATHASQVPFPADF